MHLASTDDAPKPRRAPRFRPRLRVVPLVKPDRRTRFGRRLDELKADFTVALGGPEAVSPMLAMKIADAAWLKALAEAKRAEHLDGKCTIGHLIRAERRADNAVKGLNIPEQAKPTGVAAYLAAKAAQT